MTGGTTSWGQRRAWGTAGGYDHPERASGPGAARREERKLRVSLHRAQARGDHRAAEYLRGRLGRLARHAVSQGWPTSSVDNADV